MLGTDLFYFRQQDFHRTHRLLLEVPHSSKTPQLNFKRSHKGVRTDIHRIWETFPTSLRQQTMLRVAGISVFHEELEHQIHNIESILSPIKWPRRIDG